MDPITRASKVFLREAEAHWKARSGHVLFLEADASSRGDLVKTLRLAEQSPSCRRPLFLFEAAFIEPAAYFAGLAATLVDDYRALREGAAEEGVSLEELSDRPSPGDEGAPACELSGFRAREITRALAGKLEGIDVALVPRQVADPVAFGEAVAAFAAELKDSGARLLVLSARGGPLASVAEGRTAHFLVDPDELAEHLQNLGTTEPGGPHAPLATTPLPARAGPGAEGDAAGARSPDARASRELRALLLAAAQASRKGDHEGATRMFEEARARCAAQGWAVEEAAVLLALAGSFLAAGALDKAAASYHEASKSAARAGAAKLAAQAALGEGAVRMQQKRYGEAMEAYAAAAEVAEAGQAALLLVEARRMEGTAALAARDQEAALRAWKEAIDAGPQLSGPARAASTWEEVVRALAALLRKNGMNAQAEHVEAEAAAPAVPPSPALDSAPSGAAPAAPAVPGEDRGVPAAPGAETTWVTGPVDLGRLKLPVLPFDREKKP